MNNKFYTKSGREISYYGINNIKELDDLFSKLLDSYSLDTCFPGVRDKYDYLNNPTYGQCAITSIIVFDKFGGSIHRIKINGTTHYFNKINNNYYDLTSDQFNININYLDNEIISKDYLLSNIDTKNRYNSLVDRLNK